MTSVNNHADNCDLSALLDLLGYTDAEFVSLCYKLGSGGKFTAKVARRCDAAIEMAAIPEGADVWFGVNPVRGPARTGKRGTSADITRLAALYADLDVKPGACPNLDTAHAIIGEVSAVLGTHPVAVTDSGHGLHPYWLLDDNDNAIELTEAEDLVTRFGRLVRAVASHHDCVVDSVFDLARVLRVPGTLNHKTPDHPVPVIAHRDIGEPLTLAQLRAALDEFGIGEQAAAGSVSERFSRQCLVNRVGKADEGHRNRTLFGAAKDAARQGDLDSQMVTALTDAATSAGLSVREVQDTITSARRSTPVSDASDSADEDPFDDEGPRVWRATDLKPSAPSSWLAQGRLPRAAISLLVGDEGIGKSLLWVWIAGAITTGKPLPEFGIPARDPAHVIVVVTEDDWSSTVRPRLEAVGADLARVSVVCTESDGSGAPTFPRDLHLIASADPVPALVVVDAWLDTVPSGLRVRDPQDARIALHPWKELAQITNASVLLITHTNRDKSADARDRYGITGELRKKARMTLYAQADAEGRLIVGPEKMNTARPLPASRFGIKPVQWFAPSDDEDGTVPVLRYLGASDRTAREHVADAAKGIGSDAEVDPRALWLYEHLTLAALAGEKVTPSSAVKAAKDEKDISRRTVYRQFDTLKDAGLAESIEGNGFPKTVTWQIIGAPDADGTTGTDDT